MVPAKAGTALAGMTKQVFYIILCLLILQNTCPPRPSRSPARSGTGGDGFGGLVYSVHYSLINIVIIKKPTNRVGFFIMTPLKIRESDKRPTPLSVLYILKEHQINDVIHAYLPPYPTLSTSC